MFVFVDLATLPWNKGDFEMQQTDALRELSRNLAHLPFSSSAIQLKRSPRPF
jgi:hypothetical protein